MLTLTLISKSAGSNPHCVASLKKLNDEIYYFSYGEGVTHPELQEKKPRAWHDSL